MKRDPQIEAIGDGRFKIVNFVDDAAYGVTGNYTDFGFEKDVPCGHRINLVTIDIDGELQIKGLILFFRKANRRLRPLPQSILRCHPATRKHSIYLCFEPPLDTRNLYTGDIRLCMTVENYHCGDKIFVSYGTEFIVQEAK